MRYGFASLGGVGHGLEIVDFQLVCARPTGERVYLMMLARGPNAEGEVRRALCVLGTDGRLRLAGVGSGTGLGYLTSHCVLNGRVVVFDDVCYSVWEEACGGLRESEARQFGASSPNAGSKEAKNGPGDDPVRVRLACALGGSGSSKMVALGQDGRLFVYEQR